MKKIFGGTLLLLSFLPLFANNIFGQDIKPFSLKEAIDYAQKNNISNINAEMDVQMSVARKKEIRGIGLPQINGSFDVKDYETLPTQLIPANFFGGPEGTFIPVQFGTRYNATGTLQGSQIIFNSDYIVALQATKAYLDLSQKNFQRTKIETAVSVSKAYYNVLISKQRFKLIEANIVRIKKLLDDTRILNQNGFVEKIDVDRIEVSYNNLLSEKEKAERLIIIAECMVKFQMGLDIQTQITLSDSLNLEEIPPMPDSAINTKFDFNKRIEYSLLLNQRKLTEFDLKKNQLGYLPSLVAYGSYNYQAQVDKLDKVNKDLEWYPMGLIGVTLSVPIFDGLQKNYRIQQAKISLLKTQNTIKNLENAINFEIKTAATLYQNSIISLVTQQKNTELAQGVYEISKKKYDAGIGSNLEIIIAEASLKEAQTNFFNALFDFYMAKTDYDKALGEIK